MTAGTSQTAGRHDVWYLECETTIAGEERGFSRQILARPDRTRTIPAIVETTCQEFLASVVDMSDLQDYDMVASGQALDWPYRYATYRLSCNGDLVVGSISVRPIGPFVA